MEAAVAVAAVQQGRNLGERTADEQVWRRSVRRTMAAKSVVSVTPRTVVVHRTGPNNEFGFVIGGCYEENSLPRILLPAGTASSLHYSGPFMLRDGDELVSVNSTVVAGATRSTVVDLLRRAKSSATLSVLQQMGGLRQVRRTLESRLHDTHLPRDAKVAIIAALYDTRVPVTTRSCRAHEVHGREYNFVTLDVFQLLIDELLLEDYGEYNGNLYGVLRAQSAEALRCSPFSTPPPMMAGFGPDFGPTDDNDGALERHTNVATLEKVPESSAATPNVEENFDVSFGLALDGGLEHDRLPCITPVRPLRIL